MESKSLSSDDGDNFPEEIDTKVQKPLNSSKREREEHKIEKWLEESGIQPEEHKPEDTDGENVKPQDEEEYLAKFVEFHDFRTHVKTILHTCRCEEDPETLFHRLDKTRKEAKGILADLETKDVSSRQRVAWRGLERLLTDDMQTLRARQADIAIEPNLASVSDDNEESEEVFDLEPPQPSSHHLGKGQVNAIGPDINSPQEDIWREEVIPHSAPFGMPRNPETGCGEDNPLSTAPGELQSQKKEEGESGNGCKQETSCGKEDNPSSAATEVPRTKYEKQEKNEEEVSARSNLPKPQFQCGDTGSPISDNSVLQDSEGSSQCSTPIIAAVKRKEPVHVNYMFIGESGCGKTTLAQTLFGVCDCDFCAGQEGNTPSKTINLITHTFELRNAMVKVIDTPGYGDDALVEQSWSVVLEELDRRKRLRLDNALGAADPLIHAVIFFIPPGRLKELDILFLKQVHNIVPVIPIVAKADSMTTQEREEFRQQVVNQLVDAQINTYNWAGDPEECGISTVMDPAKLWFIMGAKEDELGNRVRAYPFGTAAVMNPRHSDYITLRDHLSENFDHVRKASEQLTNREQSRFRSLFFRTKYRVQRWWTLPSTKRLWKMWPLFLFLILVLGLSVGLLFVAFNKKVELDKVSMEAELEHARKLALEQAKREAVSATQQLRYKMDAEHKEEIERLKKQQDEEKKEIERLKREREKKQKDVEQKQHKANLMQKIRDQLQSEQDALKGSIRKLEHRRESIAKQVLSDVELQEQLDKLKEELLSLEKEKIEQDQLLNRQYSLQIVFVCIIVVEALLAGCLLCKMAN